MDQAKVAFLTSYPEAEIEPLVHLAPPELNVFHVDNRLPFEEKLAGLREAEFIILVPADISVDLVGACPRLRLVQLLSSGYDRVDIKGITSLGVPVANNGGRNAIAVAEFTVALMLNLLRHISALVASVGQGPGKPPLWKCSYDLEGKTVGIIGLGAIGQKVAARLKGFGVELLGCRTPGHPPKFDVQELGIQMVSKDQLLEESDILSLHLPLTLETDNFIGPGELERMKKNAILINTSRGGVVDEEALCEALKTGRIAGAALDVVRQEPVSADHPLAKLNNVILTPHTASLTVDSRRRCISFAYENILRMVNGSEPHSRIEVS